ncbi:MAG TPA: ribosome-associated translation inhibitor RaiA [Moorella mulderi]|nr:ribosome-associated translation inhibitor RaiA [Moorella mulderi]
MEVTVRGRNVTVTENLKGYTEKRLRKIERLLEKVKKATVNFSANRGTYVVEVTIPLEGFILRGEEEAQDLYSAVDLVVEKLEKQIEKHKTRLARRLKEGSIREKPLLEEIKEAEPRVIKIKRFALKPMSVEEAILQMNLLGHSFFVFTNADTEEINVLYRRRDGNYGLIEPE